MVVLLTKKIVRAKNVWLMKLKTALMVSTAYLNTAEPACSAELDRVMKITDEVLKHMIVREDEK